MTTAEKLTFRTFRRGSVASGVLAGLGLGLVAVAVERVEPDLAAPLVALLLGVASGPALRRHPSTQPGLRHLGHTGLKVAVALLGLRVGWSALVDGGLAALGAAVGVVAAALVTAEVLGARLGVSRSLRRLIGAGFGVCGVSAVAATGASIGADDDDIGVAMTLVTVCGSLAVLVMPVMWSRFGGAAGAEAYGALVGATVHDVGQVVAASSVAGSAGLAAAVMVKLGRVVLLPPVVAILSRGLRPATTTPMPWFVVAFVALAILGTTGILPDRAVETAQHVQSVVIAAALAAIGSRVTAATLRRVDARVMIVTAGVWLAVGTVGALGTSLLIW